VWRARPKALPRGPLLGSEDSKTAVEPATKISEGRAFKEFVLTQQPGPRGIGMPTLKLVKTSTVERELQEALEAVQLATALVCEQEAKIARMEATGCNTGQAKCLLSAYRAAARYAAERRDYLQATQDIKRCAGIA
jgi:hypothetical protein